MIDCFTINSVLINAETKHPTIKSIIKKKIASPSILTVKNPNK